MKNLALPVLISVVICATSCMNDAKKSEQAAPVPTTTAPITIPASTGNVSNPEVPSTTTATIPAPSLNTNAQGGGLNPAHGQPGHRCDIGVGEPLDKTATAPTNVQKPVITTTPATTPVTTPITSAPVVNNSSGGKLNPAHGQPGHRCDISVGAPLDSKPIQANIQSPTTTSTVTPSPVKPTQQVITTPTPALPVATGGKLNPAHGQPGHRCDISVGAPLDSKPAK